VTSDAEYDLLGISAIATSCSRSSLARRAGRNVRLGDDAEMLTGACVIEDVVLLAPCTLAYAIALPV